MDWNAYSELGSGPCHIKLAYERWSWCNQSHYWLSFVDLLLYPSIILTTQTLPQMRKTYILKHAYCCLQFIQGSSFAGFWKMWHCGEDIGVAHTYYTSNEKLTDSTSCRVKRLDTVILWKGKSVTPYSRWVLRIFQTNDILRKATSHNCFWKTRTENKYYETLDFKIIDCKMFCSDVICP